MNCKNMEAESQRTVLLYGVLFGLCDAEIHIGITPQTTMGECTFKVFTSWDDGILHVLLGVMYLPL